MKFNFRLISSVFMASKRRRKGHLYRGRLLWRPAFRVVDLLLPVYICERETAKNIALTSSKIEEGGGFFIYFLYISLTTKWLMFCGASQAEPLAVQKGKCHRELERIFIIFLFKIVNIIQGQEEHRETETIILYRPWVIESRRLTKRHPFTL